MQWQPAPTALAEAAVYSSSYILSNHHYNQPIYTWREGPVLEGTDDDSGIQ